MLKINIHEAKTNLSKIVLAVEDKKEEFILCRHGKPVARISPINEIDIDPLQMHPQLQTIDIHYDPLEPLTEDEWPQENE